MRPACGPCASQFLFLSFMEGLEAGSFADDEIPEVQATTVQLEGSKEGRSARNLQLETRHFGF